MRNVDGVRGRQPMRRHLGVGAALVSVLFPWLVSCGDAGSVDVQAPAVAPPMVAGEPARNLTEFEAVLESHRAQQRIPAISAAIVKDERIVWARGFGYADVAAGREATASTPFHLASLTKTFASTVIMQLVEGGLLDLETPISDFGIDLASSGVVRVRHLLTHTSEGVPGGSYQYNGSRFALLDTVVEVASGLTFCDLLTQNILLPLGLENTAPNPLANDNCYFASAADREAFQQSMAQGYSSDGGRPEAYPDYFGTAAGLVASAWDVAMYSIAVDQNRFLSPETQERVFTPAVSNSGQTLPYGLGWFIQNHPRGVTIIWHYGYWTANSSLIVKEPDHGLTFVVLANTDMLSRGSNRIGSDANVERSVWAQEFLNAFVFGDADLQ